VRFGSCVNYSYLGVNFGVFMIVFGGVGYKSKFY